MLMYVDLGAGGGGPFQRNSYNVLQDQFTAHAEPDYLNTEQARSLTEESAEANQLVPCSKLCDC